MSSSDGSAPPSLSPLPLPEEGVAVAERMFRLEKTIEAMGEQMAFQQGALAESSDRQASQHPEHAVRRADDRARAPR